MFQTILNENESVYGFMYGIVINLLEKIGLNKYTDYIAYAVCIITGILACIVLRSVIRHIIVKIFNRINERKKIKFIDVLIKNKFFIRISNLVVPITISFFLSGITDKNIIWDKAVEISLIVIVLFIIDSSIKSAGEIYATYEVSKTFPIRGLLQVSEIALIIISGIIVISIFIEKSPAVLLGGIGAMTAIFSLIFKDAILGFIAGIQLTANDMIRIGDWIELPGHSANGNVVDLSMTTVKVENFDKTITAIPAYTLITESFINWRGMLNTGARRIKRSIYIDATGVCICDDEMLEKFKNIALLNEYIGNKISDIEQFNQKLNCDLTEKVNGRRMTNIGVFRAYITAYLKQHAGIRTDLSLMVRQLESGERGIPLEIYAFVNSAVWTEYENTQSDIFDHLYAVITQFGLRLYQNPSSNDILRIADRK